MPGILPSATAHRLTSFFGNRIDFSNFGRTSTTKGITSYSTQHIYDRAYIWGGIILGAAAGAFLKKCVMSAESESYAPATLFIAAGVLAGFYHTHKRVMQHKLDMRGKLIDEASAIKAKISAELKTLVAHYSAEQEVVVYLNKRIPQLVALISKYSMSHEDRSNATWTLLKQKAALENLLIRLTEQCSATSNKDVEQFWQQADHALLELFINGHDEVDVIPSAKMS